MAATISIDRAEIKTQLLEQRTELIQKIHDQLHGSDDKNLLSLTNHFDKVGDWVEANIFAENEIAIVLHELAELKEIDAALKRFDSENFGICTSCENAIDSRRLKVQPGAQYCIACQTAFENKKRILS